MFKYGKTYKLVSRRGPNRPATLINILDYGFQFRFMFTVPRGCFGEKYFVFADYYGNVMGSTTNTTDVLRRIMLEEMTIEEEDTAMRQDQNDQSNESTNFDPDCEFGHEVLFRSGNRRPARILALDATHATQTTVFEWEHAPGKWSLDRAAADGVCADGTRLVNKPAPKPTVVDIKHSKIHFVSSSVRDPLGRPIRAKVHVECEFLSDGSVSASAEVVK